MSDVVRIPLSYGKAFALIDSELEEELSQFNWLLNRDGYAHRNVWMSVNRWTTTTMHRQILGLAKGDPLVSDHINGVRLDNRRANLRVLTRQTNPQNVSQRLGESGYRNVYMHRASGLWRVQIHTNKKAISGGYFHELDDAVEVAKALRKEHLPYAVERNAA